MIAETGTRVIWYAAGRIERSRLRFGIAECALLDETLEQTTSVEILHVDPKNGYPCAPIGYSGPFTRGCDHGCSHTPERFVLPSNDWFSEDIERFGFGSVSHGSGEDCSGVGLTKEKVFARSLDGIRKADCVFAWIDDTECFGTLVELGYANALNKPIYIGYAPGISLTGELWFALQTGKCRQFNSATEAWNAAIHHAEMVRSARMVAKGGAA